MRDKLGRRAAMITVYALATWTCVGINFVVWEGLPIIRHLLGWQMAQINYQLSVWPVLIDMVILMSSVIWTREQFEVMKTLLAVLDAQETQTEAMQLLMQEVRGELHEVAEDVEEIVDELTAPDADVIARLESDAEKNAHRAALKRGEDIGS